MVGPRTGWRRWSWGRGAVWCEDKDLGCLGLSHVVEVWALAGEAGVRNEACSVTVQEDIAIV